MRTVFKVVAALALAGLALSGAAFGRTITVTGPNDSTRVTQRSCATATGQITCTSQSTLTGPAGAKSTRDRATTASNGQITSALSGTRANGQSYGRTTSVKR